ASPKRRKRCPAAALRSRSRSRRTGRASGPLRYDKNDLNDLIGGRPGQRGGGLSFLSFRSLGRHTTAGRPGFPFPGSTRHANPASTNWASARCSSLRALFFPKWSRIWVSLTPSGFLRSSARNSSAVGLPTASPKRRKRCPAAALRSRSRSRRTGRASGPLRYDKNDLNDLIGGRPGQRGGVLAFLSVRALGRHTTPGRPGFPFPRSARHANPASTNWASARCSSLRALFFPKWSRIWVSLTPSGFLRSSARNSSAVGL